MAIGPGLLFLSLIAAAAPPPGFAAELRALIAADARVGAIGYRLALANRALCPRTAPMSGLILHDAGQYAAEVRPAFHDLAPTDAVTVEAVVPGSPAARAGIVAGDAILAIDGLAPVLPAVTPRPGYARTGAVAAALRTALERGPAAMTIGRGGDARSVRIAPETGCAMRLQLEPGDDGDAGSDGDLVTVSTALYAATRSDDELAFVLAHELGHNILDARARAMRRPGRGVVAGREQERRADAIGLWLMARAGYDPAAAAPFVARMLARRGLSWLPGSHPASAARVRDLTREAARVAVAARAGLPLVPPDPAADPR